VLGVSAENIFCGNSSDEVLALAFQAFYSGKTNIITPDISYGFYPVWGEMYDVGLTFAPLRQDFTIDVSDYANSNGVIIANPNAPTSIALDICDIEKILQQNPHGVVLVDEAYIAFSHTESAVRLCNSYKNLLIVRTFSKSHSLAGLRVGYAVGSTALIDGLKRVRDAFNSYPLGMLAQLCAAAAISDTAYLKKTTEQIIKTRKSTTNELKSLGYKVCNSQANFIFMQTPNAAAMYNSLLENKILVRHWKKERIANFLRITIGTQEEMEEFIKCVKRL